MEVRPLNSTHHHRLLQQQDNNNNNQADLHHQSSTMPSLHNQVSSKNTSVNSHKHLLGPERSDFKSITIETDQHGHVIRPMYILGIPIHKLSRSKQFVACVFGVLFFYILYGYSQEWIFRVEGFKQYGWYLTLMQFSFYSLFGLVERKLLGESGRRIPMSTYVLIAFLTVATMGLSNTSLGYLNYPTQVIFKSCKLIPVMVGGILIQGKKYGLMSMVAVLCMSSGLLLFNLADLSIQPDINETGVLLISLALCADALIGNLQEKALKQFSASNLEMVLYSYSIGVLYILLLVSATGTLVPAFQFCLENPRVYFMTAVFSLTGYLGINFVLALVGTFGALLAVSVTTFRKTITIVLSFMIFTKPFTQQYIWSGLLVLLGILLNIYSKNSGKVHKWVECHSPKLYRVFGWKKNYRTSQFSV